MEILISIGFGILVVAGIIWLFRANHSSTADTDSGSDAQIPVDPNCCGAHEVCEFDAIKADPAIIEYFDDEELDEFRAVHPDEYTESQIDQLREVLYSLKTHEIRNWLLSLERRHIHLPDFLKEEARDLQVNS